MELEQIRELAIRRRMALQAKGAIDDRYPDYDDEEEDDYGDDEEEEDDEEIDEEEAARMMMMMGE